MTDEQVERLVLIYLSSDLSEDPAFQSLTILFEKAMKPDLPIDGGYEESEVESKDELRALLDDMVTDGLLENQFAPGDYEPSYRLTSEGMYEASGFNQLVVDSNIASEGPTQNFAWTEIEPPLEEVSKTAGVDFAQPAGPTSEMPDVRSGEQPHASIRDSSLWTGTQWVLVDAKVIAKVKKSSALLRKTVYDLRIENNAEKANLVGLVDALVAICEMAEPEVSVIDRILASPKFKKYVALVAMIATIRGAIGI